MPHKDLVRWILVVPAAFTGWFIALFIGLSLYSVADYFCPPELMLSGMCTAPWHKPVIESLVVFGAALSAVLAILCAVIVAPRRRKLVARIIFAGGFGFAVYAAVVTTDWAPFAGACIAGLITVLLLERRTKRRLDK